MLVPVSPSGMGNTFSAFTSAALLSNQVVAAPNIPIRSRPLYEFTARIWIPSLPQEAYYVILIW
jgi:hypothetical protein